MNKGLEVWYLNCKTRQIKPVYECIPTYEEADLLSQAAMRTLPSDCIVIITPGWYRDLSIEEVNKCIELQEQYKVEKVKDFS